MSARIKLLISLRKDLSDLDLFSRKVNNYMN